MASLLTPRRMTPVRIWIGEEMVWTPAANWTTPPGEPLIAAWIDSPGDTVTTSDPETPGATNKPERHQPVYRRPARSPEGTVAGGLAVVGVVGGAAVVAGVVTGVEVAGALVPGAELVGLEVSVDVGGLAVLGVVGGGVWSVDGSVADVVTDDGAGTVGVPGRAVVGAVLAGPSGIDGLGINPVVADRCAPSTGATCKTEDSDEDPSAAVADVGASSSVPVVADASSSPVVAVSVVTVTDSSPGSSGCGPSPMTRSSGGLSKPLNPTASSAVCSPLTESTRWPPFWSGKVATTTSPSTTAITVHTIFPADLVTELRS